MKRTDYMVCCGTEGKYGMPVYRVAVTDGKRYFVKFEGRIIDVTDDINKQFYIRRSFYKRGY